METTQTSRPILHSLAPRFGVGNQEQALAFYGQLGFATTYQYEGLAIVERDGVALHLHSPQEPPEHHIGQVCWIRVTNIEALYQEYQVHLPTNAISPRLVAQPWGFKEFHICDPVRNLFVFGEALPEEREIRGIKDSARNGEEQPVESRERKGGDGWEHESRQRIRRGGKCHRRDQ